jgi:hypothetical protein
LTKHKLDREKVVNVIEMCLTLFPTVIVKRCVPSSFETQSSMTVCLGAMAEGVLPISLMYFLTPSNVDKLGTEVKPKKGRKNVLM